MAYTDAQNRPSNAQAVAGTGTLVSTDTIDLLTANRNPGRAGQMRVVCNVTTVLAGGTSIQAQLITSASADLSTPTVVASGPTVALASAVAGAELLDVPMPDTGQRYLGVQYVRVGTFTTGNVSTHVVAATDRPSTEIAMNTGL
jgi:hypothetical protein